MAAIKIERDWFFPKSIDGNLSLSTQEARINEALKRIQGSDDWLEVDGIKCCSRNEILTALGTPFIQGPMSNPNPQAIPIVCPNCGANTTNRKNCEYCGSMLVRFADQNVAIDQNVFGKNALSFSSVATALKKNLELQNDLSATEVVLTEIMYGSKNDMEFDVWVYGGNITNETQFRSVAGFSFNIADANIPSSSEPRLILCFATPALELHRESFLRSCYVSLLSSADIPLYFRGKLKEKKKGSWTDRNFYYLDIGQDYESATQIITDIYQRIYGAPEDHLEVKTEKLSLEQQRNYVATEGKTNMGCSVALLPILGIGAGIAAGIVKLISHLLV